MEIISFFSGKGGSGKTSVSISIAKLLAQMDYKVLLIDFDLVTNGASYFFSPLFKKNNIGLLELLDYKKKVKLDDLAITISENFDFISSKINLSKIDEVHFSEITEVNLLNIFDILKHQIFPSYDYILLDNQAGYSETSKVSGIISNKAILVSEADLISSESLDNLISRLGTSLPQFKKYLVNKIDIKEFSDYKNKSNVFKLFNRLPPLPFDFDVRESFGRRKIPVETNTPTSFLIALFRVIQEILPDQDDKIKAFEDNIMTKVFDDYQEKITYLHKKREELLINLKLSNNKKNKYKEVQDRFSKLLTLLIPSIFTIGTLLFEYDSSFSEFFKQSSSRIIFYISLVITSFIYLYFAITQYLKNRVEFENTRIKTDESKIENEMQLIDSELNIYKNLLATRSNELLFDIPENKK
jgi:cellulose biosynthesis protein BcsQ